MALPRLEPFPSETDLSIAAMAWIRGEWGGSVLKVHGGGYQTSGHPDLIACVRGRFVGIELKQPGEAPTGLQHKRLRDWAAAGGLAGWATTVAEVHALLEHVDDVLWVNPQLVRPRPGLI